MLSSKTNRLLLAGEVIGSARFRYRSGAEKFYRIYIRVKRLSNDVDILPIIIDQNAKAEFECYKTSYRKVYARMAGELRTYTWHDRKGNTHVDVFAYSHEITYYQNPIDNLNRVLFCGYLCKKPKYRRTPRGRLITDLTVAVNRDPRSDYLPCIAFGYEATELSFAEISSRFNMTGRFQSRIYKNKYTAYEVAISEYTPAAYVRVKMNYPPEMEAFDIK